MKIIIGITFFIFNLNSNLIANSKGIDKLILDSISINNLNIGDSISVMYKLFGEPDGSYTIEPLDDCTEWCEREQKIYYYGSPKYTIRNNKKMVVYDCQFKELLSNYNYNRITGFTISSDSNLFVLKYGNYNFYIGESISLKKYLILFPNAVNYYFNRPKALKGKKGYVLSTLLIDKKEKQPYTTEAEYIYFHFDKDGILVKIEMNYPKE